MPPSSSGACGFLVILQFLGCSSTSMLGRPQLNSQCRNQAFGMPPSLKGPSTLSRRVWGGGASNAIMHQFRDVTIRHTACRDASMASRSDERTLASGARHEGGYKLDAAWEPLSLQLGVGSNRAELLQ